MRKNLKRKRGTHLCMCKGNKTGAWSRWPGKDLDRIRRAEAECREAVKR